MKLHDPSDIVVYKNKNKWVNFDETFEFGNIPFMTSGKHIARYEDQQFLVDIYKNHKDNLINMILKNIDKYNKLP